jgi:hypothetical protein
MEGNCAMSDSNTPRKDEAQGKTAKVEFRGQTFEVPREYDDWSVDLMESLEEGKAVGIVRGALGSRQWRVVKAMDLRNRDLGELSDAIAVALGFGSVGESGASSD